MVVLLHNIRSLHNVGSIFRTADGAGVTRVYLCGITPSPLDRFGRVQSALAKVALGAQDTVAWEKAANTGRLIDRLRKEGFTVIALEQDARAVPYTRVKLTRSRFEKTALVLGAEVTGLPKSILNKCDTIVDIPMRGRKESLNVAVSFGIAVYGLCAHLWTKKSFS
jgi:23S rRNA (guanosine2251-2'-O)-methyltransferase